MLPAVNPPKLSVKVDGVPSRLLVQKKSPAGPPALVHAGAVW